MNNQLTRTSTFAWNALQEEDVNTAGIYCKVLRIDEVQQRPVSFLLKFDPGASYANHNHPAGEEVYVLEGEIRFNADQLNAGDYLYTAPGNTHAAYSKTGCTLLFIVPEEVEII